MDAGGRLLAQELLHARDRLVDRLLGGEAVDCSTMDRLDQLEARGIEAEMFEIVAGCRQQIM
jgi:hypothetical protein